MVFSSHEDAAGADILDMLEPMMHMKPCSLYLRPLCAGLAFAAALAVWIPVYSLRGSPPEGKTIPCGGMMTSDGTMLDQHRKMMAEMTAQDAELTELVARMNKAPQAQKIDLLADIVSRLVAQQTARHTRMQNMRAAMRGCMPMDPDSMPGGMIMDMGDKDIPKESR
jgi:hypothetical protein